MRYEVSEPAKAGGAVSLILDCRTAKQSSLEGFTIVAGQSKATPGLPAVRPTVVTSLKTAAVIGVLPGTPLGFDVTRASDGALAALGYPARPDPSGNARAYAMWRLLTTTPGMFIAPAAVRDESSDGSLPGQARKLPAMRPAGTSYSTALSLVNSGDQVFALSRNFYNVAARWNVPSVAATAAVNGDSPLESLQTWLGVDGETVTGSALETAQAGTRQDVIEVGGVNVASYHAWAAFGGAQNVIAGLPVRSGDDIVTEVNVDYLAHGATADFYVIDLSRPAVEPQRMRRPRMPKRSSATRPTGSRAGPPSTAGLRRRPTTRACSLRGLRPSPPMAIFTTPTAGTHAVRTTPKRPFG